MGEPDENWEDHRNPTGASSSRILSIGAERIFLQGKALDHARESFRERSREDMFEFRDLLGVLVQIRSLVQIDRS